MRNRWSVFKDPVHYWTAVVDQGAPAMLAQFLDTVRRAGLTTGVYRRELVDGDAWDRDRRHHVVEASRIAVFEWDGGVVERETSCLRATTSEGVQLKHFPPLEVMWFPSRTWFSVSITPTTDLWWPWFFADGFPRGKVVDNRALAHRHTPRLNRFLAIVRATTLRMGGSWESDPATTFPGLYEQLDDHLLIRLDDDADAAAVPDPPPRRIVPVDRRNRWQVDGPVLRWAAEIPDTTTERWREFVEFVDIAAADTGMERLAVFDEYGEVIERELDCLADVAGKRHERHDQGVIGWGGRAGRLTVTLWSDVWLPWGAEVDNRVLAARNAPRLNEFLTWVRDAAVEQGGTWRLAEDGSAAWAVRQLDEHLLVRI
ncbi:hypothetical protein [Actinophytocola gossypii]|uniref:Uncharacterized protein n=1 Tax=Actinophytocola gossypii TaxID=2812003 RepID=A0ABT2J550_9PSEU|nr:hypothetical protein [Actinophytocola gossypii]MCT2582886.1 hypothetical protein [Actinophytocola gossypii]